MSRPAGRHRSDAPTFDPTLIPSDVQAALARAVEEVDGVFAPEEWTFRGSPFLVLVARRISASPTGHNRLVFSSDCRTKWIGADEDPEAALGELVRGGLSRMDIEWVLAEAMRMGRGEWHIEPVGDLGWVCSRSTRLGGRKHFVVARNRRFAKVGSAAHAEAEPVLAALLTSEPEEPSAD